MEKERIVCPQCGALHREGDLNCDLCGAPLANGARDENPVEGDSSEIPPTESSGPAREAGLRGKEKSTDPQLKERKPVRKAGRRKTVLASEHVESGGFCTSCGAAYPEGSRFCGACGERIRVVASAPARDYQVAVPPPSPEGPEPKADSGAKATGQPASDKELGRQIMIVVGAGVLLVVGLFFITIASKSSDGQGSSPGPAAEVIEVTPDPLPAEAAASEAVLLDAVSASAGEERRVKQSELIDFYVLQARMDLAGAVQDSIAHETGTEVDWIRTGNLYYDWMETVEGPAKAAYAKKTIAAYQKALAINPNNYDVRTDMAIAYMYDPDNAMQAILQTNQVLADEPNHVQANFNKGIMLLRIGRHDEAAAQFERVKSIVGDSTSQIYQRAESALKAVEQLRGG